MRMADDLPTLVVLNVKKTRLLNLPGTRWATSACRGTPLLCFTYLMHYLLTHSMEYSPS